jgi:hypothetical protein
MKNRENVCCGLHFSKEIKLLLMLEKYPVYFHMIPMSLTRHKRKKKCNNEKLFNHICIQSNLLMLLSILREYYILAHSWFSLDRYHLTRIRINRSILHAHDKIFNKLWANI